MTSEVTQADRDAAASLAPPSSELAEMRRDGRHDGLPTVQAFARHRLTAQSGEGRSGAGDVSVTYADLLEAHERILAVEMELVRAKRSLSAFADKADKWEQGHGKDRRDSTQVQHRIGDFREAREACLRIDRTLEGLIERTYAYCCAEGGGAVEHCDCIKKNWGTAWVAPSSALNARQSGEGERLRGVLVEHFPTGLRGLYEQSAQRIPVLTYVRTNCLCGWCTSATDEHEVREEWAAHVLAALRATDDAGGAAKAPDTGEGEASPKVQEGE